MSNRILIVDDDPDVLSVMTDILEVSGYPVATAKNGREAVEYLSSHCAPALIFLDLTMPIMNGLTFLRELRSNTDASIARIPVVVISAVEKFVELEQFDCAGVLQKPAELERILSFAEHFAPKSRP